VATATVVVQQVGNSNGVGQSPASALSAPHLGPLTTGLPIAIELLVIIFLIGGSLTKAAWNLLRRDPETIQVPVRPRSPLGD